MKERPILFNGEMVRAILDGRKTQTRRVMKPQPQCPSLRYYLENKEWKDGDGTLLKCPYEAGDRLWVRETWNANVNYSTWKPSEIPHGADIYYKADVQGEPDPDGVRFIWRPSIFMPRWASRITLEITSVRVERVQEITTQDVYAEGAITDEWIDWREDVQSIGLPAGAVIERERDVFIDLWDSINAKRGYSWDSNPWVWVVEFKRL